MLEIQNLNVFYGAIQALRDVSLEVHTGEIVAIIGSNGAGKSTLLRTISGLIRPASGRILFEGNDLVGTPAHQIVRRGIGHVPEGRRIFTEMSVWENLALAAQFRKDDTFDQDLQEVIHRFPRIGERMQQNAGTLSGGEQQMLAIGRAIMAKPRLLLLDEPSLGLAPNLVKEIFQIVRDINQAGTTVCLVEQNAHLALEIAQRAYVLETGSVLFSDSGANLLRDPKVRAAYLGG